MATLVLIKNALIILMCLTISYIIAAPGSNNDSCNQTLSGIKGDKYPLYLKEPLQRLSSYNCKIKFASKDVNNIVELTILSFQVGYFPITR